VSHPSVSLLGKEQHHVEAQAPLRPAAGAIEIDARAELHAERLPAERQALAGEYPERDRPLVRLPVVARFRLQRHPESHLGIVGQERLQEGLVDVRPAALACERPQVIGEQPVGPGPPLAQSDGRGSRPPTGRCRAPRRSRSAAGNTGPAPQIQPWNSSLGEKKNDGFMSPRPNVLPTPGNNSSW
jgi:hypothetical protein